MTISKGVYNYLQSALLLGRRYRASGAMEAFAAVGESPLFLFGYLLRLLRILVLLAVWRSIIGNRSVSGMSLSSVLTYTLTSEVLADLFACRSGIENSWFDGSITTRYLRPVSLFHQFSAEMLGRACINGLFFSLPLLLAAPLIGVHPQPASMANAVLFAVSLPAAVSVGLALEFLFAGIGIALQVHPYAVTNVRAAISSVLSGALIPLALMPWHMGAWLYWLPFASQASAPLRIYTGAGNPASLIAAQLGWMIVLWPVASLVWKAARERMVSFGG